VQENPSKKKAKGKGHFSKQRKRGNDKKGSWFQDGNKTLCSYCGKSGHQIEKCWTLYPHLCLKKNQKYVKALARRQATTPGEVNSLAERFEKEYFLMVGLNRVTYEDIEEWFMDSGSSHHMTGMRSIFLTFSEIDTDFYVGSGTNTRQAIKGYGYVRFQLESGGFMGIEHMLYVPYLKVNLLSVAAFEDEGYAVAFQNGQVLVYSREATQDTTIVLGVRKERLYRLLGRPIIWSNGFLDSTSDSVSDSMSDSTSTSEALSEIGSCETPSSTKGRMSP
jgi:hypothetical protein